MPSFGAGGRDGGGNKRRDRGRIGDLGRLGEEFKTCSLLKLDCEIGENEHRMRVDMMADRCGAP